MRFIIHELSYEKPIASGLWRYSRDRKPTGTLEHWRMTEAVDGFRFLRVDLDARAAESGRSYLYHLTMDENGRPVQLKYRYWGLDLEIIGTVLFEDDAVIVTRNNKNDRRENVLQLSSGYAFWFPATTGLSLLTGMSPAKSKTAVTLRSTSDELESLMGPFVTTVNITSQDPEEVEIMGQTRTLQPITIRWQDQQRKTWLDQTNWPLMMKRGDGLTAVETRHIRYQRITGPGDEPNRQ